MTTYEKIYQAAITADKQALQRIKASNHTLNAYNQTVSVIEQLGYENNESAVNLVLSLGANKDEAVRGAAHGGHQALVSALIKQGASKRWAVYGAAQGGDQELVSTLIAQGASKHDAVYSAAQGGYQTLVSVLIAQGASRQWAMHGAAAGGHQELEARIRAQIPSVLTQIASFFGFTRKPSSNSRIERPQVNEIPMTIVKSK